MSEVISKRPSLYYVEDEAQVATFAREVLDMLGTVDISQFSESPAALEAIRRDLPDILFTDGQMPEVHGIALIKEALRIAEEQRRRIVCILSSGTLYEVDEDPAFAELAARAQDIMLQKPLKVPIIRSTVRIALERLRSVEE